MNVIKKGGKIKYLLRSLWIKPSECKNLIPFAIPMDMRRMWGIVKSKALLNITACKLWGWKRNKICEKAFRMLVVQFGLFHICFFKDYLAGYNSVTMNMFLGWRQAPTYSTRLGWPRTLIKAASRMTSFLSNDML